MSLSGSVKLDELSTRLKEAIHEMASFREDADARAREMSQDAVRGFGGGLGLIACALVIGEVRQFIQGELSIVEAVRFPMLCSDKGSFSPDREKEGGSPEGGGAKEEGRAGEGTC